MTRPRTGVGAELVPLVLILACLAGSLGLIIVVQRRAAPRPKALAPVAVALPPSPTPVPEAKPAPVPVVEPEPEPPAPPPEDPTPRVLAKLTQAEAEQLLEASKADRKATALEAARKSAMIEAERWRRRESLVNAQLSALESKVRKSETEVDELALERDALLRERDARKAAIARASSRPSQAILPHKGPNGTWRRPIVVECTNGMAILQPQGLAFGLLDLASGFGPSSNPFLGAIARELIRIRQHESPDGAPVVPYIFFLVRPDGVRPYYEARGRLEPLGITFGYELADQDWEIEFPDLDDVAAWDGSVSPRNPRSFDPPGVSPAENEDWPTLGPNRRGGGGRAEIDDSDFVWPGQEALARAAASGGLKEVNPDPTRGSDPVLGNQPGGSPLPSGSSNGPTMATSPDQGPIAPAASEPDLEGSGTLAAGSRGFNPPPGTPAGPMIRGGHGLTSGRPSGTGRATPDLGSGFPSAIDPTGTPGSSGGPPTSPTQPEQPGRSAGSPGSIDQAPSLERPDSASPSADHDPSGSNEPDSGPNSADRPESDPGTEFVWPKKPGNGSKDRSRTPGSTTPDPADLSPPEIHRGPFTRPLAMGVQLPPSSDDPTSGRPAESGQRGSAGGGQPVRRMIGQSGGSGSPPSGGQPPQTPAGIGVGMPPMGTSPSTAGSGNPSEGSPGSASMPDPGMGKIIDRRYEMVVVCGPRGVILQPGSYRVTAEALKDRDGLLKQQMVALVKARRAADPSVLLEPKVRFLVQSGGSQTYWAARSQMLLSGLDWPMTTQVVQPDSLSILPSEGW
ncbi:hypothetical protein P12x_000735 [Tundrisphaera lichenicola]|uniref:hypothetical protein n=1 Tax=Tundrisphaera lichenicola TaxID=2029860 RepID=UPI003EBA0A59